LTTEEWMDDPDLIDQELERVARGLGIPPCPTILIQLSAETRKQEPNLKVVEDLITKDIGLSATLFKTVNSPFYGLRNKVSNVRQAVSLLGLPMVSRTIAGLVLRRVFESNGQLDLKDFWDHSSKVATATAFIARHVHGIDRDAAYTFGLFQNCGIPILMQRYPEYKRTLDAMSGAADMKLTEFEDQVCGTDHATTGYLLTRSWHLPLPVCTGIRYHHEVQQLDEAQSTVPVPSRVLVALGLLADHAVQLYKDQDFSLEWKSGGKLAQHCLGLSDTEVEELFEDVKPHLGTSE
jgi:HD-like signal output (HDOD) protein